MKNQKLISLYLEFHNISTSWSSNQSSADVPLFGIEFTNVSWFFIVINYLKLVNCSIYATQNSKFFKNFTTFSWYNLLETIDKVLEELNKNPATGRKRDIFTVNYEFCWFTKLLSSLAKKSLFIILLLYVNIFVKWKHHETISREKYIW